MKILFITSRVPYPPKDGGSICTLNTIKSYHNLGCEVVLLSMNTAKHFINIDDTPDSFSKLAKISTVKIDSSIKPIPALLNLFSSKSYHIQRFEDANFSQKLINILQNDRFDIIHLESLFVCSYIEIIRKHCKTKIVFRPQNVEHLIWERIAIVEKNPIKKWYISLLAKRLKNFELETLNKVDLMLPISNIDKEFFTNSGCKVDQFVVTAGIDTDKFIIDKSIEEYPNLFHIGSLDWIPNQQAVSWFLESIWPNINKSFPELKFYLAGRNAPDWILNLKIPNVEVVGEVEDAVQFINSKSIMIVPLLSGSGMRLKILEGMALAKTIITTSIGAEGIECTDGENILIANNPDEFVKAIDSCLKDKAYFEKIGNNARILAEEKYDNTNIITNLINYYKTNLV